MIGHSELHEDFQSIKEVTKSNLDHGGFYCAQIESEAILPKKNSCKEEIPKELFPQLLLSNGSTSLENLQNTIDLDICLATLNHSLQDSSRVDLNCEMVKAHRISHEYNTENQEVLHANDVTILKLQISKNSSHHYESVGVEEYDSTTFQDQEDQIPVLEKPNGIWSTIVKENQVTSNRELSSEVEIMQEVTQCETNNVSHVKVNGDASVSNMVISSVKQSRTSLQKRIVAEKLSDDPVQNPVSVNGSVLNPSNGSLSLTNEVVPNGIEKHEHNGCGNGSSSIEVSVQDKLDNGFLDRNKSVADISLNLNVNSSNTNLLETKNFQNKPKTNNHLKGSTQFPKEKTLTKNGGRGILL